MEFTVKYDQKHKNRYLCFSSIMLCYFKLDILVKFLFFRIDLRTDAGCKCGL